MSWKLGVDAGGTQTRALLRNEKRGKEARGFGGPGNLRAVGLETAVVGIKGAIENALATAGCGWSDVSTACFGIAGVGRLPLSKHELEALNALLPLECPLKVLSDLEIAYAGVLGNDPGVLVIMGTGSSILARSSGGCFYYVGGWGWGVDDLGGATDLGRKALAFLMDQYDQGRDGGIIGEMILKHAKVEDVNALIGWLYRDSALRVRFSELSPLVSTALEKGCPGAQSVVETTMAGLSKKLSWVVDRAKLSGDFTIAVTGGVFRSQYLGNAFEEMVKLHFPVALFRPEYTLGDKALEGALIACESFD